MLIKFISGFFIALILYVILDAIWFASPAGQYMRDILQPLWPADGVRILPAIVAYLLMAAGLVFFVVLPHEGTLLQLGLKGLFYGLVMFGIFEGTSYALIGQWPRGMLLVDTGWGIFLNGATALITGAILNRFFS